MRWEHFGTDIGFAIIIPDSPVVVNTLGMWKIVYRVGPRGVAVGGCIRITIPYGFSSPQTIFRTWDYYNPEFQRLVEIYSIWGC